MGAYVFSQTTRPEASSFVSRALGHPEASDVPPAIRPPSGVGSTKLTLLDVTGSDGVSARTHVCAVASDARDAITTASRTSARRMVPRTLRCRPHGPRLNLSLLIQQVHAGAKKKPPVSTAPSSGAASIGSTTPSEGVVTERT